ncbi:phage tail tape measure protein [Micromonospora sp. NPDC000207]|uniref:phage tail tape measure protein n=1 Tax=Micromonospora sp. NPDC000207 TaxID=3154246 RepID=UPI00331C0476
MPKTDAFGPELTKRIQRIDAKAAAGRLGARIGATIREQMSTGLAAAGLGAGIGAAVGAGIASTLNIGAANDKLRAQLDLTAQESARLGKVAGELYSSNYGDSMATVNEAISSVIRNVPELRNASAPVLKEISAGALDIARVFDQDVGGVTSAVSSMLKSGLAPSAEAALDILTKGFQSGADKGQDLLDTFTEYSVQFDKLGLDGPRALGVINQLLAGGARNGDLAADAIKEFSLRAIDGSKTSAEGYKLLGLNAEQMTKTIAAGGPAARTAFGEVVSKLNAMKDPVDRNTAGVALFGTKFEDLGASFRKLDVDALTDGLGKVDGATKGLADQSDQARINGFIRTLQQGFVGVIGGEVLPAVQKFAAENKDQLTAGLEAAKQAGQDILPALKDFGGFLVNDVVPALASTGKAVGDVVGWFREHDTVTKALVGTLAGAVIAVKAYQAWVVISGAATAAWSVATRAAALVQAGYNAVLALGNSTLAVWLGVKALEFGAWVRTTAATVAATTAQVASRVAMIAARGATLAWVGVQWALNAALMANPLGLVVAAVAALIAVVVLAYQKNETFRGVVQAVWAGIKAAVSATVSWFTGTAWPWIKKFIDLIVAGFRIYLSVAKQVWSAVFSAVALYWGFMRDRVFTPLKNFVTKTIPEAFRSGTMAVGKAWSKLEGLAKKPVKFVVETVINQGVIGTFNKVSGFFGGPKVKPVALPSGMGDGHGHGPAGPGTGDGLGGMLGFLRGPAKWVKDRVGSKIKGLTDKFGSNPLTKTLGGMGNKLVGSLVEKAKSLIGSSEYGGGGSVGAGGLRSGIAGVLGALRSAFGSVPLVSGLRVGSRTLTGNRSYHADGRAIDIAPVHAWAQFIRAAFGPRLRELITPWQSLNLRNGRPHTYSGAVWRQHNFAGGNAHIHAAMAKGGVITEPIFGIGQSGRTYSFGEGGRHESVVPHTSPRGSVVEEIRQLRSELARGAGGPLIGSLTLAPTSERVRDQVDEVTWALRRIGRGGVYAGP